MTVVGLVAGKPIGHSIGSRVEAKLRRKRSAMASGTKKQALRELNFGNQVAEEEREALREYFVRTQAWDRLFGGEIDIIYGPKGSGKSALYVLIQEETDALFDERVLLVTGENPRGAPAFKDLVATPPTTEREFIGIWKLYTCSLLGRVLEDFSIANDEAVSFCDTLRQHNLLPRASTALGTILQSVRNYVARVMRPRSMEGGVVLEPNSGMPIGVNGKIVFDDPDMRQQDEGLLSVDDLLRTADRALKESKLSAWIMLDRLDVAFDESSDLEKNALRALFRAYRDLRGLDQIKLKIFLRTDIWERITEEGFREATHMSRDIQIKWNKPSIQNLIVRRLANNKAVMDLYGASKSDILLSSSAQDDFFARVFPGQVEVGEKQSTTIDWLIKRTSDGGSQTQPRDMILFLNRLCEVQNQRLERGEPEPTGEWLFERSSFKEALPALSEYRISRVLYAEYPDLRRYIEAMREQKTEQNALSLAKLWGTDEPEALSIARRLRAVGFFEERGARGESTFWVPFVYRSYLSMVQGKVDEIQTVSGLAAEDDE